MNNITKIVLAVIAAVVIYFVLVKGPEQANSTQKTADGDSSSRRTGTPSAGTSANTPTATRPATPNNMNDREIEPSTTSNNRRFTTISLQEASTCDNITQASTCNNRTQATSTRGTSTRGSSTTGTRTTSSTSSRTSGTGTNPRRVSRQYYPLQ